MRRGARRLLAGALASCCAALAAACGEGGPPADLFVVERDGSVPGARLTLRITDDGRASCDGRPLVEIGSEQLIEARRVRRELEEPASRQLRLPAGEGSILRYRVRSEEGGVAWSDTSPRQPEVLFALAKLTRDVAKGPCGLER